MTYPSKPPAWMSPLTDAEPELSLAELQAFVHSAPARTGRSVRGAWLLAILVLAPLVWILAQQTSSQAPRRARQARTVIAQIPKIPNTYSTALADLAERQPLSRAKMRQEFGRTASSKHAIATALQRTGEEAFFAYDAVSHLEPPGSHAGFELP